MVGGWWRMALVGLRLRATDRRGNTSRRISVESASGLRALLMLEPALTFQSSRDPRSLLNPPATQFEFSLHALPSW